MIKRTQKIMFRILAVLDIENKGVPGEDVNEEDIIDQKVEC